ncbi:Mobile element protein [[Actinomadura] parvosata subsp. kistnae]|nr:Mobile element protein [Actinomadura parvosata subsp. kistnae]
MRALGLQGARRGKKVRTTTLGPGHVRAADRLRRDFAASRPNAAWVADFTHVTAWCGVVYVAFVVDIYSRAIVGWAASLTKHTTLVLDALDMALWRRKRAGHPVGPGLIHHSDAGSQLRTLGPHPTGQGLRPAALDGQRRRLLRQRHDGVVLVADAGRTPRPSALQHPHRARQCDLRVPGDLA